MKRSLTNLFLIVMIAGCATGPAEIGTVEEGSGTVRMAGQSRWKLAEGGSIILDRDEIKTANKESMVIRIQEAVLALNENTHLTVGREAPEGYRHAKYWKGDLFLILEAPKGKGWLFECAAGKVLIDNGVAILRLDPVGEPDPEGSPSRLQIVMVRGEAVVESLGLARTLKAGELGFLFTGAPPTSPTSLSREVVEDFEWALDQTLGRPPGPPWPRPPLYDAPRAPSGSGEKGGGASSPGKKEESAKKSG